MTSSQRWRVASLAAMVMVARCPADALTTVKTKRPRTLTSSPSGLGYRKGQDSLTEVNEIAAAFVPRAIRPPPTTSIPLPEWFGPKGHLLRENIEKLQATMRQSFFTEKEIRELFVAIEDASRGDRSKMAGAAEFCTLLVETMEMGFNALVAASYHYSSCVAARGRYSQTMGQIRSPHELRQFDDDFVRPQRYGEHPAAIADDAWHLKGLEMVFSSMIDNAAMTRARVSPNSQDAENLRNLLLAESKDWRAIAIRSAACLYRLRGLKQKDRLSRDAARTAREALHVYAPLAARLGMYRLKNELENAAFCVLYRRQHAKVTALNEQVLSSEDGVGFGPTVGQSMSAVLDMVSEEIQLMLENDPVFSNMTKSFKVSARIKEPYSMWRKMLRKGAKHTLDVTDAIALRIVFDARKVSPDEDDSVTSARERALCYYVRELCISRWGPLKGNPRFKDYIEKPKPNGYQSLHYTATTHWNNQEWMMEIQIRSGEMHKVAEYGLASHWDYKSSSKQPARPSLSSGSYLSSLQDWHWQQASYGYHRDASPLSFETHNGSDESARERALMIKERTDRLTPYIQAFAEAKSDLARDHVFVFLSQNNEGTIVGLPSGASVLDAVRQSRTSLLGKDLSGFDIVHNGGRTILSTKLKNGDVLCLTRTL